MVMAPNVDVAGVRMTVCGVRYRLKGDLQWQYVSLERSSHIDHNIHEVEGLLSAVEVKERLSENAVVG